MRWSLPLLLCVTIVSFHYSTEAERYSNPRYLLGKALLRRAREINETKNIGDVLEDEMSEEEREKVLQTDALEDIFVGSGSHVYESQGKSETSGSRREETSTSDESGAEKAEAEENDSSPTSGDSNAGERGDNDESDEDEDEKSEDDDDDETETKKDQESQESSNDEDTSGSGLTESESAVKSSSDISGSGSGSEQQNDATEQSGSGESTIEKFASTAASQVEASGTEENAAKKSEIETASGDSQEDEDEESGSADVIKKGIESLSRLLTPVASGYDFELYSGNTAKNDKEEETEAEGESEKGVSSDSEEVHVKQCKRVCEDPMTYNQCAVPRCDYKMGTIKDLCIYLCKHQTPVCRQQCE